MDRKLLYYLPPVLREVLEMQAINGANEPEIAMAWDALALVLANQFLETADTRGVSIWEKELKILPKDTDSLEVRKARIKAQWNIALPYSFRWMQNWLTSLYGLDGHEETIENYVLTVQLLYDLQANSNGQTAEVLGTLRTLIPGNMLIRGINKYCPVVLENHQALWFASLRILLGQKNREQLALEQLRLAMGMRQKQGLTAGLRIRSGVKEREEISFHQLRIRARMNSYGLYPVRLNGERRLDGTWLLDQKATRPPALHAVTVSGMGVKNRQSISAAVTAGTMWRLDGTFHLNGERKLNAKIVRSEI